MLPHLVSGPGGLKGEVWDLRNDVEKAFLCAEAEIDAITSQQIVQVVTQKSDLPDPIAGVITLEANTGYMVMGSVDLGTDVVKAVLSSSITGRSATTDKLITASASPLLTIDFGTGIFETRNITLRNTVGPAFLYDGQGQNAAIPMFAHCAFYSSQPSIVRDVINLLMLECWFANSPHGIAFEDNALIFVCIMSMFGPFTDANAIGIDIRNGCTFKHCNIVSTGILANGTQIGIRQDAGASMVDGRLGLNEFEGTGTYISGFTKATPEWRFHENSNLLNSRVALGAGYSASTPGTNFTNPGQGSFAIVPATLTVGVIERFTQTSPGVFRYDGKERVEVMVNSILQVEAQGPTVEVAFGIAVNGTILSAATITTQAPSGQGGGTANVSRVITIDPTDTVEFQLANNSSGVDVNVLAHQVSMLS